MNSVSSALPPQQLRVLLDAVSTVHHHLLQLRRKGYVEWVAGKRSTLRPLLEVVAHG